MNDENIKEIVNTFVNMYLQDFDKSLFCERCASALFGYALGRGYMNQERYYAEQDYMAEYIDSIFPRSIKTDSIADQIIEEMNNEIN